MLRVQRELAKQDWQAEMQVDEENDRTYLEVQRDDKVGFIYEIRLVAHQLPDYAFPEMSHGKGSDTVYYRAEVFLRLGGQSYDIFGFDQHDIIIDILDKFEKHLIFLEISPGNLPWNMVEHDEMLSSQPVEADEEPPVIEGENKS